MWHKVNDLSSHGLNKSQIAKELNLHRSTVIRYLNMSEIEFTSSNSYQRQFTYKLHEYELFIKNRLDLYPFLSASQIHDRLKEHFSDLPDVNPKTVYNYVSHIRRKYDIPKCDEKTPRPYEKLEETAFGQYAQVDFGERYIQDNNGKYVKVYFFAIVLSRSRYKFVYFQQTPFTTQTTIYAHELAFQFFGGIPKEVIYDQDKVLIHKENLGDLILTKGFRRFVSQQGFKTTFCRKSDPESKGKVENVVKYVKSNFLSGREFRNICSLNNDALSWLDRTGNGKVHSTTQLIPTEVFKEEQGTLLPYLGTPTVPEVEMKEFHVRKDNTVNFKSNFYTVPTGTHKGARTSVYISVSDGNLNIFDKETGKTIATHRLSNERGKLISNTSHKRDRSVGLDELEKQIKNYLGNDDFTQSYLDNLHVDKSRYYRDNLLYLIREMIKYDSKIVREAMLFCQDKNIYNTGTIIEIANSKSKQTSNNTTPITPMENVQGDKINHNYEPESNNINNYQTVFQ